MLEIVHKVKKQLNNIVRKLKENGASNGTIRLQQIHNDYFIQITKENCQCYNNQRDKLYSTARGTRTSMLSSTQTDVKIQNTNNVVSRTGGDRHQLQRSTRQGTPIPAGRSSGSDANGDSCRSRSYEPSSSNGYEGDEQESEPEEDRPSISPEPSAVEASYSTSNSSPDLFDGNMSRRTRNLNQRPLPSCHSVLSVSSRHPDFGSPLTPSIYNGTWVCVPGDNLINSMSQYSSSSLSNNESGDESDEDSLDAGNDTRKSYNTTLANLTVHNGSLDISMQDNSELEKATREFSLRLRSLQQSSLDTIESWKVKKKIICDKKDIIMDTILSTQNILHFSSKNSFTIVAQHSIWSIIVENIFFDASEATKQELLKYFVGAAKSNGYFGTTISLIIDIHKNHCNNEQCQDS